MKRILWGSGVACWLLVGVWLLSVQGPLAAQQAESLQEQAASERIPVQYARACLRLAEIELRRAEEMGDKIAGLRLEWLRANVEVARQQLEIAKELEHGSTKPLQLAYARNNVLQAAKRFQAAEASNEPPLLIEEMRLRVEVARLRMAMWQQEEFAASLIDQMQWQIDRLTEEIVELNHRLQKLEK